GRWMGVELEPRVSVSEGEELVLEWRVRCVVVLAVARDRSRKALASWCSMRKLFKMRIPDTTSKAFAVRSATASRIFFDTCLIAFLNRFTTTTMKRSEERR